MFHRRTRENRPANYCRAVIAAALLAEGVIGRAMPQGDILGFAPPFCITKEEVDEVAGKTARAITTVLGK